jgi:hypothetical protein
MTYNLLATAVRFGVTYVDGFADLSTASYPLTAVISVKVRAINYSKKLFV